MGFDVKKLKDVTYSRKNAILACKQAWQGGFDFGRLAGLQEAKKQEVCCRCSSLRRAKVKFGCDCSECHGNKLGVVIRDRRPGRESVEYL